MAECDVYAITLKPDGEIIGLRTVGVIWHGNVDGDWQTIPTSFSRYLGIGGAKYYGNCDIEMEYGVERAQIYTAPQPRPMERRKWDPRRKTTIVNEARFFAVI